MSATRQKPSGACPSFFQALCRTASMGGSGGYEEVGFQLARVVSTLSPDDMEDAEWIEQVEVLKVAIVNDEQVAALAWLDRWLPRCMALIPARRRDAFYQGVDRAAIEFDILDP
jgi:hypothetical protein